MFDAAGRLPQRDHRRGRHFRAPGAARRRARPGRDSGRWSSREKREPIAAWDAPFDKTSETSPRVKLARQIAKAVRLWIDRKDRVGTGAERHAVRPGDILVLVRQRGPLFEAIIRALKNEDIDVAGADRLVLTEHIAVMDLLALADALLLPEDDLALATVLKIAAVRPDGRGAVRARLGAQGHAARGAVASASRRSRRASTRSRAMRSGCSPFAFYANLLGAGQRRGNASSSRLGPEANDVIDEFLNLALDYESRETPSLQGFVAWLRTASAEIKRDMEIARDEVRVMTVHGAKGLEAPIVILADTTTRAAGPDPASAAPADSAGAGRRAGYAGPAGLDADQEG